MVQKARLPKARFSTTRSGMLRVVMPVIGPDRAEVVVRRELTAPEAASSSAAARSAAQPSNTIAPQIAPRSGPHMRSHSIGGPACRIRRSASSPGISSPARRTSASTGSAARMRRSASALAASIFSSKPNLGWSPVDLHNRGAVGGEVAREAFEPDVDDAHGTREQRVDDIAQCVRA